MESLELSLIDFNSESLTSLLERSELNCHMQGMAWEDAWGKLARIALYRSGPDVSEVGTTWLDALVSAGAVRPFTAHEVELLGGADAFLPVIWQTVSPPPWQRQVWAIPWRADTRVIFYWRDMLEQAGVDEEGAFQTTERVEETMQCLQDSGIPVPWGIWGLELFMGLHNAASWIWARGGDFVSADGRQVLLDRPETCEGLQAYLRLSRYMPPEVKRLEGLDAFGLFVRRQVAVVMGASGWLPGFCEQSANAGVLAHLGVAKPPGPAYVGGGALVVWQHARHVDQVVKLIRFLLDRPVQVDCFLGQGALPVHLDVLSEPAFTTDSHRRILIEALKGGRTLPVIPNWVEVEEKLSNAFAWLWDELMKDPDQDLEGLVVPYLEAMARRLAVTLGTRR
jgi:multiple sugar transport system substrate-binding protein